MNGRFVQEADIEREQLDWGGLGWISRPPSTGARQLTVLDVSAASVQQLVTNYSQAVTATKAAALLQ